MSCTWDATSEQSRRHRPLMISMISTSSRSSDVFTFQGSSIADVEAVVALAAAGRIRSEIDVFPLARGADAYAALEAGALRGRAVVVPDASDA